MHLIKLDATDSTNNYLKTLLTSNDLNDFTVVSAHDQFQGRGQMGATWQSKKGKNLTFSLLKKNIDLPIADRFLLNMKVSLAIFKTIKQFHVPDLSIKWPNDILSGTSKLCGILIENVLIGAKINHSIIGIGLNVNQLEFNSLKNVTSLKLLLGTTFNLDELLQKIVLNLESHLERLNSADYDNCKEIYENILFRKDKPSTFEKPNGELFMGFIRSVTKEGKLIITLEDNVNTQFDLKEIRLLY